MDLQRVELGQKTSGLSTSRFQVGKGGGSRDGGHWLPLGSSEMGGTEAGAQECDMDQWWGTGPSGEPGNQDEEHRRP